MGVFSLPYVSDFIPKWVDAHGYILKTSGIRKKFSDYLNVHPQSKKVKNYAKSICFNTDL